MDRSFWLTLLFVVLSVALVVSGRAYLDVSEAIHGANLVAEIDDLGGQPSNVELADRVTEAAGCIRGFRPSVRSCWYAWADPSRPDYLRVVAERVRSDATSEARLFSGFAIVLWLLVILTAWKTTRPRPTFRDQLRRATATAKESPPGRLTP
jgi:hypothetical protein